MLIAHKLCVPWLFSGSQRAAFVTTITLLPILLGCGALDKDSNCLNEKAGCFKADKTRPQLTQSLYPASGALISQLPYADLIFSEELNNPKASDFVVSGAGGVGLSVISVEKTASYTYRLTMNQSAVSNGPILISFVNLKDYAGNVITGVSDVTYQGNVDIAIRLTATPTVLTGISNTAGGYNQSGFNASFTHGFVDDDGNAWSACITAGAISCPLGSGFANGSNLASLDKAVSPGTAVALTRTPTQFALGQNRLVIYVENVTKNRKGINSWPIFRDDTAPASTFTPPGDAYSTARQVTLTCSDNADKIIYTSASQQSSAPAAPANPTFDTSGNPVAPAVTYTGPITTPATPDPFYTTYKWLCIDKGGNKESSVKTATYIIDSSLPDVVVNLDSSYHDFVSTGGYTSTTLNFTTNQSPPTQYRIAYNTTGCNIADGTDLVPWQVLPVSAGNAISNTYNTTTHFTSDGVYNVRICVKTVSNAVGFAYLPITRDSVRPTTTILPAGGNYGSPQNVTLTCSDNVDKIAYTTDGTIPSFFANGQINVGSLSTGPITVNDGVTTIKYLCRDKAGNEQLAVGSQTYTIDSVLPTITVLSNTYAALSTTAPQTSTTISWTSSRPSSSYKVYVGGTDCGAGAGTQIATGTTDAITSNATTTPVTEANLGADGTYNVRICVANLIGNYGNTTVTLKRDTVAPSLPLIEGMTISQVDATNFTVSWNASTDANGIAGYRIYRGPNASTFPGYPGTPDYTAVATSATLAMPDTSPYYLKIVPFDIAGNLAVGSYAPIPTKPAINLIVSGLSIGQNFKLTDGSQSPIDVSASGAWTTSLSAGSTYNFAVSNSPAGKVCAIHEKQFGTLTGNLTINITCVSGYIVGGNFQIPSPAPLNYNLYRGNTTVAATSGTTGLGTFVPSGMAFNGAGTLFLAEAATHKVYRLTLPAGSVTVIAGSGVSGTADGLGAAAQFYNPSFMTSDGTNLYVSQVGATITTVNDGDAIRKIDSAGNVTTLVSGAQTIDPEGLALSGNILYWANRSSHQIKSFNLTTGVITVIAGSGAASSVDGTGTSATFNQPMSLVALNGKVYVTEFGSHRIRTIDLATQAVTTLAGSSAGYVDGPAAVAQFNGPAGLISDGYDLYVPDYSSRRIRRIRLDRTGGANHQVTTISGSGASANTNGIGATAAFIAPILMATDGRSFYVSDEGGAQVRKVTDSGLVGYWPIDPGVNPNDYNSDGAAMNNGTVSGGNLGTTVDRFGVGNLASTFNGSNQYITASAPITAGSACNVSIAAWFKPNSLATTQAIAYNGSSGSSGFGIWHHVSDGLQVILGGSAYVPAFGSGGYKLTVGVWTHVAARCANGTWSLYANGHKVAEAAATATAMPPVGFSIGRDSGTAYANGAIADVRVYNRALGEGEINELAQDAAAAQVGQSFNTRATGLLMQYEFRNSILPSGPIGVSLSQGGVPTVVTGADGDANGARHFSSSYHFFLSDAGLPRGNAPRTLCSWVKPTSYPAVNSYAGLIQYGANVNNQRSGLHLYTDPGGTKQIALVGQNNNHLVTYALPLNTWSHMCGTFDGTNAQMYVNGSAVGASGNFAAWNTGTGSVGIGADLFGGPDFFMGALDDVRIYNNALSPFQIRQLATQVPAGLVARYDFTGDRSDIGGFAQDLNNNGVTLGTDRFGATTAAANFNGSSHFDGPMNVLPTGSASRTLCAWSKPSTLFNGTFSEVVMYGANGAGTGWGFGMDASGGLPNGRIFILDTAGDVVFNQPHGLNVWRHLCATYDGTTEQLFLDGTVIATKAIGLNTASGSIYIGRGVFGSGDYFNGSIDDVRVYNRKLNAGEVRALAGYHPMQVTNFSTSTKLHLQSETALCGGLACTNNASVGSWPDSSGTGNSVSQATAANQPTWIANGIGGKPALQFDQSNDFLINNSGAGFNTFNFAHFAVIKSSTTNSFPVMSLGTACGVDDVIFGSDGTGSQYGYGPCNVGLATSGALSAVTPLTPQIFTVTGTPTVQGNIYTNGVAGTPYSMAAGAIAPGPTLTIGARYGGTGFFYGGLIAEELFFNAPLSATSVYSAPYTDRQIVECYLSAKYSIPLAGGVVCP
jgi:hypothetical protein